jgi:serine/threonine-protein kinase RsbW/stage II sporulation protein AB (anti-sigma F factor)
VSPAGEAAALDHTLPAVPGSVPRLRSLVAEFAAAAGLVEPELSEVKLAITEAITNAVMHAYAGQDPPGPVGVNAHLACGRMHVTVHDEGCGIAPRLDSPGLGLGLPFIAQTADTFDVARGKAGGTEVRMSFLLPAAT